MLLNKINSEVASVANMVFANIVNPKTDGIENNKKYFNENDKYILTLLISPSSKNLKIVGDKI